MQHKKLPRILYLSDVPVELSSAGATLLYRLLEYYPKDKLMIIQGVGVNENQPRIPGVEYHTYKPAIDRLRYTRFAKYTKSLFVASQFMLSAKAKRTIHAFKPDVILTVSIRLMWVNAYRLSKRLHIPLYVVLHDDWLITENYGRWQKKLVELFEKMYLHASARFCISPTMEKYYYSMYGVHGDVIYPSRGKTDRLLPVSVNDKKNGLKFCYAGSLFTGDFGGMLDRISGIIEKMGGELHVFSYWNKELLSAHHNLVKKHVTFHPFMHSSDLMEKMNKEMDVAILLNSFDHEKAFMYNFSSKLVDYSSAGLPVFFYGPASAGSSAWAISIGYQAIVTEADPGKLEKTLTAIHNCEFRKSLAMQIREHAQHEFSYETSEKTFLEAISEWQRARIKNNHH
ncbi:MAG: glycosyltransferase [Ferruginibacter sp.]